MGRREPDGLIEADRVVPTLVGGELHQPAAVFSGYLDRPLDHPLDNRNLFAPSQRYQRGGGRDAYRPYDPWIDRHAGAGNPVAGDPAYGGSPAGGNAVPIDGGMIFLLLAGVGLGIWKMYDYRKRSGAAVLR